MRLIFLIGYMCSGKSTLARALSRLPGVGYVDTDHLVEQRAGMPIPDIFATQGETAFRSLERDVLADICRGAIPAESNEPEADSAIPAEGDGKVMIVACGGGLPCQPGAMDQMRACGMTVWLRPSAERLIDRMMEGRGKRPLLSAIETREQMSALAERMQADRLVHYSRAQAQFDSSLLETEDEIDASARLFASLFF